jgi:hypothetical protein
MKTITLLMFLAVCNILSAQDDLYSTQWRKKTNVDSIVLNTNTQIIQYNLGRYYKERQTAIGFAMGSVLISSLSLFDSESKYAQYFLIASGVTGIISTFTFIHAERWLKRASISISPGGVKINF